MHRNISYALSFFLLIAWFFFPKPISAENFRSDYQVEYFLNEAGYNLQTKVKFRIAITNLRSDVYVNTFSLSFPKTFQVRNIEASDDTGDIKPLVTTTDAKTSIELEFNSPHQEKESTNIFFLEFMQDNLFKINGNVWEVMLPTIDQKDGGSYNVIVNLPANTAKKIAISKPKPTSITGSKILWENPKTQTIYAVFGDTQYYQLDLNYQIVNPKIIPVYTDIAFPPDSSWQKIYVSSINPAPSFVYVDDDGNFMGRYILKPKEAKTINFSGTAEIFAKPREEVRLFAKEAFEKQKEYLLTQQPYWQLTNPKSISSFKAPKDIYDFTTKKLSYNYSRLSSTIKRLGAQEAFENPENAVCTEFTDLFIALSRENGIYSREVQGYGFSSDPQLRPLSLISDVLHAWPEYFDEKNSLWIPVDPTWENTSGIDYFSSFDLNHIAFAIHGKRADYPLPAGTYKTENSKDVSVKAVNVKPEENPKVTINLTDLPKKINDNQTYTVRLQVKNEGNVFLWNVPVEIRSEELDLPSTPVVLNNFAPFEKKEIPLELKAKVKGKKTEGKIAVFVASKESLSAPFSLIPFYYDIAVKISYVFLIFCLPFIAWKLLKKTRKI